MIIERQAYQFKIHLGGINLDIEWDNREENIINKAKGEG